MNGDILIGTMLAVVAFAVLSGTLFLLKRLKVIARFRGPLNILFLVGSISVFIRPNLDPGHVKVLDALLFSTFAYIGVRLADIILFDVLVHSRRRGLPVPVVLRVAFRWFLLSIALFVIGRTSFPNADLTGLGVSAGLLGIILGYASQDTLGNLIAGLALTSERPFSIGDWVRIGDFVGRVADMTWRATRLQTKMLDYIIIPNSTIAREYIVNYSRPTQSHGFTQEIGVNYGVPPNKVRRSILRACNAVPEILNDPAPLVWLHNYGDFSIDYTVKFFIRDFARLEQIQSDMMDCVWYEFKREDIVIPFPIRDVRPMNDVEAKAERDRAAAVEAAKELLGEIPIFSHLSQEERDRVAESMEERIYGAGEALVCKGDAGNTFYVILEGSTSVHLGPEPRSAQVAVLKRGDYFGEMSLLTGEPRSATVVAVNDCRLLELSHVVLQRLLKEKKSLAEDFAKALRERAGELAKVQKSADDESSKRVDEPSERALLNKIWDFFGI